MPDDEITDLFPELEPTPETLADLEATLREASAGPQSEITALGVVPWEDYARLKLTLKAILRVAADDDPSVLRGYVMGITIPIRDLLESDAITDGR
jgi:hypothetical protein